jgi:3-oxoacyl-[acyl-carrier-protein] synthase-3
MNQPPVSLTDVSSYLPGEPVGADYYAQFAGSDDLAANLMFRAPKFRHHVGPDETAIDMVERAAQGLIERHGRDVIANVDVLITHAQMPDVPFYGGGGGIAHRLGMRPNWVLDLHNGGCAAFVLGLKVARQLLASGQGRTALIAVAQNAAGQIFDQPGVRARRRRRGWTSHCVGRVSDTRHRVPHLRRIRRRHDARYRPAPQMVAARPR